MAIQTAHAIREYDICFYEEPCLPENPSAMATVARECGIPVATGERIFTTWGFRDVLGQQAAAVVQPDLAHCGGILQGRKIAAIAEATYAGVAPHNPLSPVNMRASLHLDAAIPHFVIQEWVADDPAGATTSCSTPSSSRTAGASSRPIPASAPTSTWRSASLTPTGSPTTPVSSTTEPSSWTGRPARAGAPGSWLRKGVSRSGRRPCPPLPDGRMLGEPRPIVGAGPGPCRTPVSACVAGTDHVAVPVTRCNRGTIPPPVSGPTGSGGSC